MKKAIGQTVRDLKRGVNKKVLKVPSIEQKVLDATSNEPWGPHGTLLADIAQATRNYHEYQMIMSILWKRANDTGKNWRHVFKALSVLDYLVAHGSERVIDDIREHAYQLQTLSDFQYIDSGGRDQGSNIRKKSHGLVALVNDKDKIQEVREKAASNREKFRNTPPGSYSGSSGYGDRYDDDRYGSRDDERNGNGRGREYGNKGDDRYAYGRDGREYDGDDYRGRSPSVDNHSSRGRSSDREKYEDDEQYSSRGSGARADEQSQDAPPSYEEAVSGPEIPGPTRSPTQSERDGETSEAAPNPASPPPSSSPTQATRTDAPAPTPNVLADPAVNGNGVDAFDEFDPRGSHSAASTTSSGAARTLSVGGEMDLLGSLSDSFTGNPLAVVPTSAPALPNQGFDDPFGDGPFRAIASTDGAANQHQQGFDSMSFQSGFNQDPERPQHVSHGAAEGSFSDSNPTPFGTSNVQPSGGVEGFFSGTNSTPFGVSDVQPSQGAAEGSFSGSNSTPFGEADGFFSGTNSTPFGASNVQPSGRDEGFFSGTNSTPFGDSNVPPSQDATEGAFSGTNSTPFGASNVESSSMDSQYQQPEFSSHDSSIDILADILPPTGPHQETGYATAAPVSQSGFLPQTGQNVSPATFSSQSDPTAHQSELSAQSGQPSSLRETNFLPHTGENMSQATFSPQSGPTAPQTSFSAQSGQSTEQASFQDQPGQLVVHPNFPSQFGQPGFAAHGGQPPSSNGYVNQAPQAQQTGFAPQPASVPGFPHQISQSQHGGFQSLPGGQAASPSPIPYGNYNMHSGYGAPHSAGPNSQLNATNFTVASQTPFSSGQVGSSAPMPSQSEPPSTALIPSTTPSAKPKQFQTKSTVWTDTLSRGLVNLDISGVKTNPMSDIGIDFDAINRKEKRMEKPVPNPVTSTIHMGKAMGSGSGMGRAGAGAGAGAMRPSSNPMMGTSAGAGAGANMGMMGMGGPRPGVGMGGGGGYGGMNQQAMGAGMGMNMQPNMGMGQPNMGMGQPNMSMGQPNMGMGQPNMGMGQQNMGMGHQNMGMGQPNMGMGQQNMGMGHQNMGMGQPNMGMGFPNMGMGHPNMNLGGQMEQQGGYPPGSNMQGGYNPMMGSGNYGQNPYGGGGYR